MKRKKLVAGNWKMNLGESEAIKLANEVKAARGSFGCDVVLIPSFLFITDVKHIIYASGIHLGAQDCSIFENGAYTGEVSAKQLKAAGVEYVIIGHSERREHFGENHGILKQKLEIALRNGLKPIFCCGEPLQVRNHGSQMEYVLKQLQESLFDLSAKDFANITIAYEPIWAIGTGLNATPAQAQEMHAFIRKELAAKHPIALQTRIIYGGSCNPGNAHELFACPDVDGGLIGGASLKAKDFIAITAATR
jgi:triosephosphate isomerase